MRSAFDCQTLGWQECGSVSLYPHKLAAGPAASCFQDIVGIAHRYANHYPARAPKKLVVIGMLVSALSSALRMYFLIFRAGGWFSSLPVSDRKNAALTMLKAYNKALFCPIFRVADARTLGDYIECQAH